jgi:GntR family transcriptional regulator
VTELIQPTGKPKYLQIREHLLHVAEEVGAGGRLPAERDLAAKFDVARMTVRQAIDGLERDGHIERRGNRGAFVRGQSSATRSR